MDIVHPRVAGIDVHKKIIWVAVRLPGEAPGQRVADGEELPDVLAVAAEDSGLAGGAGRHRCGDGKHRGVLVAGVSRAGAGRDRGVRVQRRAHAQRAGPQTGHHDCQWIAELHEYGLLRAQFHPGRARWRRCGSARGTARS